jgi:hypothetical protein
MYVGSKGLPMHSSPSLVYGETLARCIRKVYPLDPDGATPVGYVFLLLWLGHMYMGSKGLPTHSPPSPVYSKTLAHCTRAIYPPRFLLTAAHQWACVFLWLWLGHMYMGNKGLPMHSSQSLVNSKTLAHYTYLVYPLHFFGRCQDGGLVCSMCFG